MRRVTLLCSLILVVAQLSAQTAGAVSFKTFVSARNHYHIVYPATWRVRRAGGTAGQGIDGRRERGSPPHLPGGTRSKN